MGRSLGPSKPCPMGTPPHPVRSLDWSRNSRNPIPNKATCDHRSRRYRQPCSPGNCPRNRGSGTPWEGAARSARRPPPSCLGPLTRRHRSRPGRSIEAPEHRRPRPRCPGSPHHPRTCQTHRGSPGQRPSHSPPHRAVGPEKGWRRHGRRSIGQTHLLNLPLSRSPSGKRPSSRWSGRAELHASQRVVS